MITAVVNISIKKGSVESKETEKALDRGFKTCNIMWGMKIP